MQTTKIISVRKLSNLFVPEIQMQEEGLTVLTGKNLFQYKKLKFYNSMKSTDV